MEAGVFIMPLQDAVVFRAEEAFEAADLAHGNGIAEAG